MPILGRVERRIGAGTEGADRNSRVTGGGAEIGTKGTGNGVGGKVVEARGKDGTVTTGIGKDVVTAGRVED